MTIKECLDIIEKLYREISIIEENTVQVLSLSNSDDLHQEDLDFSNLYTELKSLLIPVLENYKYLFKTSYASKIKKVYYVALCEMIKQDFYRGMLITFRNVTGTNISNMNHYYDLLSIVSQSQGLQIEQKAGRRMFERAYILETGIPRNMSKNVMKMFLIYWRYFREEEKFKRLELFYNYLQGQEYEDEYILDPKDAELFEKYREELSEYSDKVYSVFNKLDDIFSLFDSYDVLDFDVSNNNYIEKINEELGYDMRSVLRDSDIIKIYDAYMRKLPISKFKKILRNLPRKENIITPKGFVSNSEKAEKNIICGIYEIRSNKYEVVIDPTIGLEDMIAFSCETVHTLGKDYYSYFSRDYFDVEVDGMELAPREVYYRGQCRYAWIGKVRDAGRVNIDGHIIMSSQKIKISGKVIKCYDRENNRSKLQYLINSIKVNEPAKPYGKLSYTINDIDSELICVGNNYGIYYRENIRIEFKSPGKQYICFNLNGEIIERLEIDLEDQILFDKWNGTRYYPNKENDKHSGSFICFTKNPLDNISLGKVSNQYEMNGYHVVEFDIASSQEEIRLFGEIYGFGKTKAPYFFIKSEIGDTEMVDQIDNVFVKTVNLNPSNKYWFEIENEEKKYRCVINQGEFCLRELICNDFNNGFGKWTCSLWEKQKKLMQDSFVVIPELSIKQLDECVLEGKDIWLEFEANDDCFVSNVGEFCNRTKMNIGSINLEIVDEEIVIPQINTSVYIDKWNIVKEIQISPKMWGIRTRDKMSPMWKKTDIVNVDPDELSKTECAIFSTGVNKVYINGELKNIEFGKNDISWKKYIKSLKNKNELVFSDDRSTYKQLFSCIPQYSIWDVTIAEESVLTIRYAGPVSETLTIRYFVDGFLEKSFQRDTTKNTFLLHVLLGKTKFLTEKTVSVEIATSRSPIPIQVYREKIEVPIKENEEIETSVIEDQTISLKSLSDLCNVDNIAKWIFFDNTHKITISTDVNELIRNYFEVIK